MVIMHVVDTIDWLVHDYGKNSPAAGGIHGQLTHCRLDDGTEFYVRENARLHSIDHFCMSAGARQGRKMGDSNPGVQVLELCAPAARWRAVAELVRAADKLGRPVVSNRRFTVEWARRWFRDRESRAAAEAAGYGFRRSNGRLAVAGHSANRASAAPTARASRVAGG